MSDNPVENRKGEAFLELVHMIGKPAPGAIIPSSKKMLEAIDKVIDRATQVEVTDALVDEIKQSFPHFGHYFLRQVATAAYRAAGFEVIE